MAGERSGAPSGVHAAAARAALRRSRGLIASDQKRLVVDTYTRYRVTDPLRFYQAVGNIGLANQRLASFTNSGTQ